MKNLSRDKGQLIMDFFQQEYITIVIVYVPNIAILKFIKQILTT